MREVAAELLTLAEKQRATVPFMLAHRSAGLNRLCMGDIAQGRAHFDRALAFYDPVEHRALATRFGQDARVAALSYRSLALWMLGYPDAALADANEAVGSGREIDHAATLIYAPTITAFSHALCGNYTTANAQLYEAVALADQKGALFWKATGMVLTGCVSAVISKASEAVQMITSALAAFRSTGATLWVPAYLSHLARANADLRQLEDSWRCIDEALTMIKKSKESWYEAEVNRNAGEIELESPEPDAEKAEAYFDRAMAVARQQQAKSWELRAAMSMARLWRDQGKRQQAHDLLTPVYGWFTEGFDMGRIERLSGIVRRNS